MNAMELWFSVLFTDEVEGTKLDLAPGDPGNYTPDGKLKGSKFGISARQFPKLDIANLTVAQAAGIAKDTYWDFYGLDKFPPGVGILLADSYYNGGTPIRWLQAALGVTVDSAWGPKSQAALDAAWAKDSVLVLQKFMAYRFAYLADLNRGNTNIGWGKRCAIMLCLAIQASGGLRAIGVSRGNA